MMTYRLRRFREPPLVFEGELIAEVTTKHPDRERWTELRVYVTRSGTYVAEEVGRSLAYGESDRCGAFICRTQRDVERELGDGRLARELYTVAGFRGVERVD